MSVVSFTIAPSCFFFANRVGAKYEVEVFFRNPDNEPSSVLQKQLNVLSCHKIWRLCHPLCAAVESAVSDNGTEHFSRHRIFPGFDLVHTLRQTQKFDLSDADKR